MRSFMLVQQEKLWTVLRKAYPDVRFFLRIAPRGSDAMWVSDLPRRVQGLSIDSVDVSAFLRNELLYFDLQETVYDRVYGYHAPIRPGDWRPGYEDLQATAVMLQRPDCLVPRWTGEKEPLRETLRAVALGGQAVHHLAQELRAQWAAHLRLRTPSTVPACGQLLAGYLLEEQIGLPVGNAMGWEEKT